MTSRVRFARESTNFQQWPSRRKEPQIYTKGQSLPKRGSVGFKEATRSEDDPTLPRSVMTVLLCKSALNLSNDLDRY
jgi:hypothetical protein